MRRAWMGAALVLAGLASGPASAYAQAIAGVVTDSSGSVMPGVTVMAASPALIEGSRTAVTGDDGRYTIINLRPGVYSVTFSLEGFTTVKRDDIVIRQDFTAPINVQMTVGSRTEIVEVTVEAPLVDVQNLSRPQTITSEMLSTLPINSRTLNDVASRVVGVAPGGFGLGLQYRGSQDVTVTVDGNRTAYLNAFLGGSGTTGALSAEAYQEYSFTSGIDNVDSGQGGIRINVVPKDGGNKLSASIFGLFAGEGWSAKNIGDFPGLTEPAKLRRQYDFNPSVGGPIIRDRLWFQNTFRASKTDTFILNAYEDVNLDPLILQSDLSKPVSSGSYLYSGGTRVTWQATKLDKLSGFYDDQWSKVPRSSGFGVSLGENPDAMGIGLTPHTRNFGGKWTRTHSASLLFEAGLSRFGNYTYFEPQDGLGMDWAPRNGGVDPGKFIGSGLPIPALNDLALREITPAFVTRRIGPQVGITSFGNSAISSGESKTWTANASVNYLRGGHTLRAGLTFFRGSQLAAERLVGDVVLNYSFPGGTAGGPAVANSVVRYLPQLQIDDIDADWGFFVQDTWVRKRLTIKPSLRLDLLKTSFDDQRLPASAWLPEQNCSTNRAFCGREVTNLEDLTPRLSVSYDVFGDGRLAVKGGFAKYVDGNRLLLASALNPISNLTRSATSTWSDVNGDRTVINADGTYQMNEIGPVTNNFGTVLISTQYDPEVLTGWGHRGNIWETQVGVDYQILSRFAATVFYYRRSEGNIRATDNLNTDASAYDEFCAIVPDRPSAGALAGQTVCGLYDLTPPGLAAFNANTPLGAPSNFNTFSKNLGNGKGFRTINNGVEITLRSNLTKGAFLAGGLDIRSQLTDTCGFSESGDVRFCRNRTRFNVLPKISGAYTLPFDIQIAGNYQIVRGPGLASTWTVTSTGAVDDVAIGAAAGLRTLPATHVPVGLSEIAFTQLNQFGQRTKSVSLAAAGQEFLPYVHTIDFRFAKIVRLDRYRVTLGVDMYNAFNADGVTSLFSQSIGTTAAPNAQFRQVSGLQAPRQYKMNATFAF